VCEDLNVTGMLGYKTAWNGARLLTAGRWYPSGKTCSACCWQTPSLTLTERTITSPACGYSQDRDVNAALNLLAQTGTASRQPLAAGRERTKAR
jgi:putative transposase